MAIRTSDEKKQEALRELENGTPIADLAVKYGVKDTTIKAWKNAKQESGKRAKASDPVSKVRAAIAEAMKESDVFDLVTTLKIAIADAVLAGATPRSSSSSQAAPRVEAATSPAQPPAPAA